jgi:CRP-like cAMP-binding protein
MAMKSSEDLCETLGGLSLFRHVPTLARRSLARAAKVRWFSPGEQLLREGEMCDLLYVFVEGRVRVERSFSGRSAPVTVAELGRDETVGYMRLLTGKHRSATVTAIERTVAVELPEVELIPLLVKYPIVAFALLKTVIRHLDRTGELLAAYADHGLN